MEDIIKGRESIKKEYPTQEQEQVQTLAEEPLVTVGRGMKVMYYELLLYLSVVSVPVSLCYFSFCRWDSPGWGWFLLFISGMTIFATIKNAVEERTYWAPFSSLTDEQKSKRIERENVARSAFYRNVKYILAFLVCRYLFFQLDVMGWGVWTDISLWGIWETLGILVPSFFAMIFLLCLILSPFVLLVYLLMKIS